MANKPLKPGHTAPASGQYAVVGPRGGKGPEVTVSKGETLPPAPKGSTYRIADRSNNKSGRG